MTPFDQYAHGQISALKDGRIQFTFTRAIHHPPASVWKAITDSGELKKWFPGIEIESKMGGRFRIWFNESRQGPCDVQGTVSAFDAPRLLRIGSMTYQIETSTNGSLLTFIDKLHSPRTNHDNRSERDFALSVLGGWHNYLDSLCASLDGLHLDPKRPELDYSNIPVPGWEQLDQ